MSLFRVSITVKRRVCNTFVNTFLPTILILIVVSGTSFYNMEHFEVLFLSATDMIQIVRWDQTKQLHIENTASQCFIFLDPISVFTFAYLASCRTDFLQASRGFTEPPVYSKAVYQNMFYRQPPQ